MPDETARSRPQEGDPEADVSHDRIPDELLAEAMQAARALWRGETSVVIMRAQYDRRPQRRRVHIEDLDQSGHRSVGHPDTGR